MATSFSRGQGGSGRAGTGRGGARDCRRPRSAAAAAVAPGSRQRRPILAALFFLLSLTAFLVDQAVHRHAVLTWYDLNVYNDAGLITRQLPSILYTWELKVGVQFTYTPFAALMFAGGSLFPVVALRWFMTIASLAAIPLTAWLAIGGMGKRGAGRAAAALAVSALALWIQPVSKALFLGQIEPLLMLLVVWDLTRKDSRQWKGIGIGIAAGIKLVPLLFIPYLLLAGKVRQAAVATGAFVATVVAGFVFLPGPSASYWLTGYFMRPGRTGSVHSLVNQSLLGRAGPAVRDRCPSPACLGSDCAGRGHRRPGRRRDAEPRRSSGRRAGRWSASPASWCPPSAGITTGCGWCPCLPSWPGSSSLPGPSSRWPGSSRSRRSRGSWAPGRGGTAARGRSSRGAACSAGS